MGTDIHARHQAESGRSHPPAGRDDDDTHALRAGKAGPTQRKSVHGKEPPSQAAGSEERRRGSDTGKPNR